MTDQELMRQAISLAWRGAGWTSPNPLVGAVIVKDGRIIGSGYHERYGQAHAERNALASCSESPEGATVYVTLEPCCHTGKQPPCTDALIDAKVGRVIIGSRDPNPLVSGKGVEQLRSAGIEVVCDFLRDECDELNHIFLKFIRTGRPYVVAKWAMTADGKIATCTGDARWVSGNASRRDVHELRQRLSSIMVGIGTVRADDPFLTCRRDVASRQPLRVVCDSRLRIPLDCQLVKTVDTAPLLVATAADLEKGEAAEKAGLLQKAGAEVLSLPGRDGRVDLIALLIKLGERQVDSVLLEGGATLNASAFEHRLVDEAIVYLAPKVVGGDAPTPVDGRGVEAMADAWMLGKASVTTMGDDVRISFRNPDAAPYAEEGK